jgi:hypothetical protein
MAGFVVDAEGKPVVGAVIDHTGDIHKAYVTNSEGKFVLDTRAPAIVVRLEGYKSKRVATQASTTVKITLQRLPERRQIPICSPKGDYYRIEESSALLLFPVPPGVEAAVQGADADYASRGYYLHTDQGYKWISHGSGPFYTFGLPLDDDVWLSVEYEEVTYGAGGETIVDARGKYPNGNRWRYLGRSGESASYSNIDETTARTFDKFLDGVCLAAGSRGNGK